MKSPATAFGGDNFIINSGRAGQPENGVFPVWTESGLVEARRAAGCLLAPAEGDTVLIAENERGTGYILTVLERSGNGPAVLDVQGDMTLASRGRTIIAGKELLLAGEHAVELAAPVVSVEAKDGSLQVNNLSVFGKIARMHIDRVRTSLSSLDFSAGRVVEKIVRRYSRIEELADERYGRLSCLVREALSMKGRSVTVNGEERVAIDGKKIDLG